MFHYIIKPLVVLISTLHKSRIFFMWAKKSCYGITHGATKSTTEKPAQFVGSITVFCLLLSLVTHSYPPPNTVASSWTLCCLGENMTNTWNIWPMGSISRPQISLWTPYSIKQMWSLCSDIWTLSLTVTFASQGQDWDTEELLQEDVTGWTESESEDFPQDLQTCDPQGTVTFM